MKYIIDDYSNEGILFVGDNIVVANMVKSGLVDTSIRVLYPFHDAYKIVNRVDLFENDKHFQVTKKLGIIDLPESSWNEVYLERRRLVKLRYPLMEFLARCTYMSTSTTKQSVWEGIENNMQFSLRDCDPSTDTFSDTVQEYAHINEISPAAAYREISLQVNNIHSIKMRAYAFQQHFATKINNVTDKDQQKAIADEMTDIFFKDTWI